MKTDSSLTGVWDGLYSYSMTGMPEVPFTALLFQSGDGISGTTHETMRGAAAEAFLEGGLAGAMLHFRKTYDGSTGLTHSVAYEGTLSGDGAEIEGTWTIGTMARGRFLMIRAQRKTKARKERATEKV